MKSKNEQGAPNTGKAGEAGQMPADTDQQSRRRTKCVFAYKGFYMFPIDKAIASASEIEKDKIKSLPKNNSSTKE
ncbi:MAG TPA: hypothetical protein DDX91_00410 [Ruminococcaceae bacterium]|nr:hypothetical protein [Oscillospiraceae bacterium]